MRILMLAPEEFFFDCGTPFSVAYRLRALSDLGHTVDLLTYPFGAPIDIPRVHCHRIPRPPGIRSVRIGPSVAKAVLDLGLYAAARRALTARPYDLLHTHEEAGVIGAILGPRHGIPHLYDMHSWLPEGLENYAFPGARLLEPAMARLQRWILRRADHVIAICPDLVTRAREAAPATPVTRIDNVAVADDLPAPTPEAVAGLRSRMGVEGRVAVVYTGSLEANQGLDLLIAAMAPLRAEGLSSHLVLVGGTPTQAEGLRALAARLGVADAVTVIERQPVTTMPLYLAAADILVSPRALGTNTPLKVYSYLQAGRAIVATDLWTHTQILEPGVALLVPPTAAGLAEGIAALARDPARRDRLSRAAATLAAERYAYPAFVRRTRAAVEAATGTRTANPEPALACAG